MPEFSPNRNLKKSGIGMEKLKFTKMQGIGNDYVYLYGMGDAWGDMPQLARIISDRHFGVGSDGLILIDPSDKADLRFHIFIR